MFKRTVPLLALAALVVPAAAAAKDVSGPATLAGHGPVRGVLRAADGPARVKLQLSGKILVSGRARDLEVSCTGANVKQRSAVNKRGLELMACKGRRMTVVVSATAFPLRRRGEALADPDPGRRQRQDQRPLSHARQLG